MLELVAKLVGESEGKEDEVRSCLGDEEMAAAGEGVMLAIAEQLSCPGDAMEMIANYRICCQQFQYFYSFGKKMQK
jgi:hypothetical protein